MQTITTAPIGTPTRIPVIILSLLFEDEIYKREFAEDSGYEELVVYPKK